MTDRARDDAPAYVYAALLAAMPFVQPTVLHVRGAPACLSDVALLGAWAAAAFLAVTRRIRVRFDRLFFVTVAYVGVLFLSAIFGVEEPLKKSLLKLAAYALYMLVPWLATLLVTDERRLGIALRGYLLGAGASIGLELVGIVGFYARTSVVGPLVCSSYGALPSSGAYPRMCGTLGMPNMLANFLILAVAVILAAGPILSPAQPADAEPTSLRALIPRGKWAIALVACTIAMLFTLSAGFGGFVLVLAIYAWVRLRDAGKLSTLARGVIVAIGGGAAVFFMLTMVSELVPAGQGQVTISATRDVRFFHGTRPTIWASALDTVRAHPLLGKGYSAHVAVTDDPEAFLSPDQIKALHGRSAGSAALEGHDVWLNVAGQAGLLGLAAFVAMLVTMGRSFTLRRTDGAFPYLGVALTAGFIGAVLYHGVVSAMEESRNLWGFLGLATAAAAIRARGPAAALGARAEPT